MATALIGSAFAQSTTQVTGSTSPTKNAAIATHTVSVGAVRKPLILGVVQSLTRYVVRMDITLNPAKLKQTWEISLVCVRSWIAS